MMRDAFKGGMATLTVAITYVLIFVLAIGGLFTLVFGQAWMGILSLAAAAFLLGFGVKIARKLWD